MPPLPLREINLVRAIDGRLKQGTVSGLAAVYNRYSYIDEMRMALGDMENKLAALPRNV